MDSFEKGQESTVIVVSDTCTILMLLRIAPKMFQDDTFGCITTVEIVQEIRRTQKFASKYPWRKDYYKYLKTYPRSDLDNYSLYFDTIRRIIHTDGVENERVKRPFGLSNEDISILATALSLECQICTSDRSIIDCGEQQFEDDFRGNVTPLELINNWIEQNLIEWDDEKQDYLRDWKVCNESPQSKEEIERFEDLTGRDYCGS